MPTFEPEFNDEERELLRSADVDGPAPGARERTLLALGIGSGALGGAVVAGTAKAAATSGKVLGFGKWLALLVTVGATSGAVLHYRAQTLARAAATHLEPPTPRAVAAPPVTSVASPPPQSEAEAAPSVAKSATPTSSHTEPDIGLEIESLDKARRASNSGDFGTALAELDRYDRSFKQGRLRPEALLLRVQTLLSKGDRNGAKTLGNRFLARYPKSPLAPRIQKLLGAAQ